MANDTVQPEVMTEKVDPANKGAEGQEHLSTGQIEPGIREVIDSSKVQYSVILAQDAAEKADAKNLWGTLRIGGLERLAQQLGLEYEAQFVNPDPGFSLEHILRKILPKNKNGAFVEVINDLVARFISLNTDDGESFSNWSHNLCHLFEGYSRDRKDESLFVHESNFPTITKLIEETLDRATKLNIGRQYGGNLGRIFAPLIQYNLDNLDPAKLDGEFPLRPEAITDPQNVMGLMRIFGEHMDGTFEKFLFARTPKDLLIDIVKAKASISMEPAKLTALLAKIEEDVGTEAIGEFLAKNFGINSNESATSVQENLTESESASEVIDAVCVDVDDTLIVKGKLNTSVVEVIVELKKRGRTVIVFSGGDNNIQTERLLGLGFPSELLPVQSKADFKGKVLETLIDDSPANVQGFKTVNACEIRYGLSINEFDENGKMKKNR